MAKSTPRIATIQMGSCCAAQGLVVKNLPCGKVVIDASGSMVTGYPIPSYRAAPQTAEAVA